MTQARYQSLMDAVSGVIWATGAHAAGWRAQMEFLRSADGSKYVDAVIAELDAFRATLRGRQRGSDGSATHLVTTVVRVSHVARRSQSSELTRAERRRGLATPS